MSILKKDSVAHIERGEGDSHFAQVRLVSSRLRKADLDEIAASSGTVAPLIVESAWSISVKKWVMYHGQTPVALFGVAASKPDPRIGVPWMLGTDGINFIKKFFIKNSKKYILEMGRDFDQLTNMVDVRNKLSIKWLKWCGFILEAPIKYGVAQRLFHQFHKRTV